MTKTGKSYQFPLSWAPKLLMDKYEESSAFFDNGQIQRSKIHKVTPNNIQNCGVLGIPFFTQNITPLLKFYNN